MFVASFSRSIAALRWFVNKRGKQEAEDKGYCTQNDHDQQGPFAQGIRLINMQVLLGLDLQVYVFQGKEESC